MLRCSAGPLMLYEFQWQASIVSGCGLGYPDTDTPAATEIQIRIQILREEGYMPAVRQINKQAKKPSSANSCDSVWDWDCQLQL